MVRAGIFFSFYITFYIFLHTVFKIALDLQYVLKYYANYTETLLIMLYCYNILYSLSIFLIRYQRIV